MKKKLLILAMALCTSLSANAATWVALDSGNDNIQIFIDSDSVKYISNNTCTYAVLYKKGNDPVRVVYMKSDYKNDKAGVIRSERYVEELYNPSYYSKHASAYMKNIMDNAIFTSAHAYAFQTHQQAMLQQVQAKEAVNAENIRKVANYEPKDTTREMAINLFDAYIEQIKSDIFENWNPSSKTVNETVNLIISVNADGSYNGYKIINTTSSEDAKRAAIAAVNLTAPFAKFPENEDFVNQTVNIPITFEQKRFKKNIK